MRKHPSYTALLRPTHLLISEKSATYTIKWSYTIIWQVRVNEIQEYRTKNAFYVFLGRLRDMVPILCFKVFVDKAIF